MPLVLRFVALLLFFAPAFAAAAAPDNINGTLDYKGFTVDLADAAKAPNRAEIVESLKKQIDIVDGCGAKAEIMAFFRTQKLRLKFGHEDGGVR